MKTKYFGHMIRREGLPYIILVLKKELMDRNWETFRAIMNCNLLGGSDPDCLSYLLSSSFIGLPPKIQEIL